MSDLISDEYFDITDFMQASRLLMDGDNLGSNAGKDKIDINNGNDNNKDIISASNGLTVSSDKEAKVSTVTPKTGDSENMAFYGGIALISFAGISICIMQFIRKRYMH